VLKPTTEKDQEKSADLRESRDIDDVIKGEPEGDDTSDVSIPDVGSDQPTSTSKTWSKEIRPTQYSRQEVLGDMSISAGKNEDSEAPPSAATSDYEEPTVQENAGAQFKPDVEELDDSIDETVLTLPSATIDCDPGNDNVEPQSSPGGRQRPTRKAHRPSRYREDAFDTQFQPTSRRRNCRRIQKRDATGNYVTDKREWQGENKRHVIPTESEKATTVTSQKVTAQTAPAAYFPPEKNTRRERYPRCQHFIPTFH